MVGVPDRRMAGTQTQQPDEARHIWRAQDGRGPAYKRQRDRRGAEEGQAMSVRGRGLDFVPKAVGRRRRVWTRAGQQCPGLQHDRSHSSRAPCSPSPASVSCSVLVLFHSFIYSYSALAERLSCGKHYAHQVPDFKKLPVRGRSHTERSI